MSGASRKLKNGRLAYSLLFAFLACAASAVSLLAGWTGTAYAAPVVDIRVEGVEGELRKNVLAFLSIEQQKDDPGLNDEMVRRLHEKAPDEIARALQPFGFYRPDIRSELLARDGSWLARYVVNPGAPVRIRDIDLAITGEGAEEYQFKKLVENFPLKRGDVLNHERYENAKQTLQEIAAEQGYLDAVFPLHRVEVHLGEYYAAVDLHFDTGPLYRFGEVTFHQDILRPEFMARFVPFERGDPYKTRKLLELQSALYSSDYFSEVVVQPRPEQVKDLYVPVEVELEPKKKQRYTFGLGYGTDTGVRGIIGWEHRRLNRRGHKFNTELRLSEIQSTITAKYTIPMKRPATDHLSFNAGFFEEDTVTSTSETALLGVSYNRMRRSWQQSYYLNYQKEKFDIGGETGKSTLLIPGTNWTRIKTDNRIYTTHGSKISLDLRGAHDAILSDTSLAQLRLNGAFIRGLWEDGRILLRGDFGTTSVGDFSKLPASLRFFAGGDRSVRGYAYRSLGPENAEGTVVGGRHLIVGSVEYEHRIYKKWSCAVFYDFGNAINSLSDPLKQGAGAGARWVSPVGPVRVDFAWALSDKHGRQWRIHFSVGPDI